MYTIDRDTAVTPQLAMRFAKRHQNEAIRRFDMLDDYYCGRHEILRRSKEKDLANNRLVCNHAKYISDMAIGYLIGTPVKYSSDADITQLLDWLQKADAATQDADLAKDASVYGTAFELVYLSDDDQPHPKLAVIDPRNAFVVYDDTVEHAPVFGARYYPRYDLDGRHIGYQCSVYTAAAVTDFACGVGFDLIGEAVSRLNPFGMITLNEVFNNEERQGDFEQQISLINAYNTLQSDRVNDKEQFVKAILLISGQILGDTEEEEREKWDSLRRNGLLMLETGSKAEWLTRQFDEASVELLRKSLENDIHKYSAVPCMTDESFAANASGVAMRYKLLAFEQMTGIKQRYFQEGLRYRLQLFCSLMAVKGLAAADADSIDIVFTRNLPANETELAQVAASLGVEVSNETLLSILPFVSDPAEEAAKVEEQKEAQAQRQTELLLNTPIEDADA